MPQVTLSQAAELEGKSYKCIQKSVFRGTLEAEKVTTSDGRGNGFEYRIDIRNLSKKAQVKYYASHESDDIPDIGEFDPYDDRQVPTLEDLTAEQREEAFFWERVIKAKDEYIAGHRNIKTEKLKEFVEQFNLSSDKKISVRTIYSRERLYRRYGVAALADGRKAKDKKGHKVDERAWSIFTQWYLDERKYSVQYIYNVLKEYLEEKMPEVKLASYATVKRAADEIEPYVIEFYRNGNKAYEDRCAPYLVRDYEEILSNDYWSADYHTLDLMVKDDVTGEVYRPHIVVMYDVRSRKMLSMRMRKSSDADGVFLAFRDAAIPFGLPDALYLDNGSEFLVHDFGGRGVRKSAKDADYGDALLDVLGIKMVNAIVKNSKAKAIERQFRTISEQFAKLFLTFCGGRPERRPESHNKIMKNENNIPLASVVAEELKLYIEGFYNQRPSRAEGLNGMSPNQCYAANLIQKRVLTEDQANLLLLRRAKAQKVDRDGVYITIGGKKIWYFDAAFVSANSGQKVYVRYDPDRLESVRVYDEHQKFMAVIEKLVEGGYEGADDTEAIKRINSHKKKLKNNVKNFMKNQEEILKAPELREVVMDIARKNIAQDDLHCDAKVLTGSFGGTDESEVMRPAVGAETTIDFDRMIKNAEKNKRRD